MREVRISIEGEVAVFMRMATIGWRGSGGQYGGALRAASCGGHRLPTAHERQAMVGVQRWRQPIALNRVTAMVAQVIHLFLGFHAFSDHIEPERVGHGDHGGDRKSTRLNSSH